MTPRTRDTTATQHRLDNLRLIIGTISGREMDINDICALLKFSPSGARKYIADLRTEGVIKIARYADGTATHLGRATYRLTPDKATVDAFLAQLGASKPSNKAARNLALPEAAGCNFHILVDDTHYAVRVSRAPAAADPLALPPEFFRPAVHS